MAGGLGAGGRSELTRRSGRPFVPPRRRPQGATHCAAVAATSSRDVGVDALPAGPRGAAQPPTWRSGSGTRGAIAGRLEPRVGPVETGGELRPARTSALALAAAASSVSTHSERTHANAQGRAQEHSAVTRLQLQLAVIQHAEQPPWIVGGCCCCGGRGWRRARVEADSYGQLGLEAGIRGIAGGDSGRCAPAWPTRAETALPIAGIRGPRPSRR